MKRPDSFTESDFRWFHGIVEDISDPAQMGRVRVRCYGYHSPDKKDIATSDLPWAHVMLPATSASVSGIGVSATGLLQGSFVLGFFRDGIYAQEPIIIGTIASMSFRGDFTKGFTDPSGTYPLSNITEDIPKEATSAYASSSVNTTKASVRADCSKSTAPLPSDNIAPVYPSNKVIKTKSGHSIELDDTTGKERVSIFHKSGSWIEILPDGKITIMSSGTQHISSKTNIELSAEGDVKISANKFIVNGTTSIAFTAPSSSMEGTFSVSDDVVADGISLVTHVHGGSPEPS